VYVSKGVWKMRVNFLGASDETPLSKTFEEIAPGKYREESYPHISKFNSIERTINTTEDFYNHIVACANEGLCLLKGELDRPLINESRAGHTEASTPTSWICLDVDYTVKDRTPPEFLEALGTAFVDVNFIFQKSSSMHIKAESLDDQRGWRGHFFVLLDSPQSPQALKQWLIQANLGASFLLPNIGLSASGGALTFPLDVTTCQNDKLLYIASPRCINFDDPVSERFEYYEGNRDAASLCLDVSAAANQASVREMLHVKRHTAGLTKKTFRSTQCQGHEVLTNPDPVTVTTKKEERGFVYLNLNGGDSWGYFFPVNSPDILHNFKGEPCMYMWDVDKDIYNEYSNTTKIDLSTTGAVAFGFLWPDDDNYYRGFADPDTGELFRLHSTGSKAKLKDFYTQNGVQVSQGWAVDEWQLDFDPTTDGKADFAAKTVNTYKQTDLMRNAVPQHGASYIPPLIDRVLTSVCVNEETKKYFLNWIASIFQTRIKTNTAWIFQGVQGTGKGVLFTHILSPLIGGKYCHEMTMDRLDDDFNAYLSDNILLFIDEAKITDSRNGDRLLNRIKNLVTEPEQHIRGMRRNAVTRKNYSNIILASNYDEIIPMEVSDRRFNVAPRQEEPIQLEYDDILTIRNELAEFANFLHSYSVDTKAVKKVLLSEARDQLIILSETTIDAFFHAVRDGDLSYFTQYLDDSAKSDLEGIRYFDYALVVKQWIETIGEECNVGRNDLRICYQYLQNTTISATKFSRMCTKYGHQIIPVRANGKLMRGLHGIRWYLSDEELAHHKETAASNVVPFKEKT